ncbi:MAG: PAS/PAC sensor hybrid histidine kinase [Candidatus Gottesmanbacteria bacterium GW2011_GWA2_43_14]|uniref:histidine kinase n=1 Tax=Candidatus Gottesmanbacteria bacterium GW2011_GWA2_43_14 TaxID=1618443 RepID=A0A0G1DEN2_9BACT|nr:MAG: PAS/PAC sensor hybrid histidine kinase [Candidatus Gottesmanbacteria bacterium GW2011_GWA2_43_14]
MLKTYSAPMALFLTFLSVILCTITRILLIPFIGGQFPYLIFFPAIFIAAGYGGFFYGFLSTVLCLIMIKSYIIPYTLTDGVASYADEIGMLFFLVIGIQVSWFLSKFRDSKQELRKFYSAVEQAELAIFITDKKGIIEYINPAFEKITQYSRQEVIGNSPRIIKSGKHDRDFYNNLWKTITGGETFQDTMINKKKNGQLFYVAHSITPIKDNLGNIRYFVGIWRDITEQKEIENRKDEFISIASHELKTPLTSIKGYVQIIREKLKNDKPSQFKTYISRMDTQVNFMTDLVYELLDVTRIQAGKLTLNKHSFSLNNLIRETVRDMKITTKTKIDYVNGKPVRITADKDRLAQVLKNLISNAIKYSHKGKKIVISSDIQDGQALISVRDFGIGIPVEEQQKIFGRFYQIKKNRIKGDASFGIGLYISDDIIKQHGGRIQVASTPGKGSEFTIFLPLTSNGQKKKI